jgi:hypothetical protein
MVECGHVYVLQLAIAGKPKLLVPAFIEEDGRVRFFVINTNRTEFQQKSAEVAKHVLPLLQKNNGAFLTHDSWLVCDEVIGGWKVGEIEAIKECHRGPLDVGTLAVVRAVIQESKLHSERDKAAMLAQWPD